MSAYFYVEEIERDDAANYKQRTRNYLNYMRTRSGQDCEKGHARPIFNARKNDVKTEFILAAVEKQPPTKVGVFFLMLNPNAYHFDCQRLVRFVFNEYKLVRGVELEWFATVHHNTLHSHAHVIIMPTDARDRSYTIAFLDKHLIRYFANRWLKHHHEYAHRLNLPWHHEDQIDSAEIEYRRIS